MLTLYDSPLSLNCYKVRLLLSIFRVPYQRVPVDLRKGEHRTPEMLLKNHFGQIPVLTTDSLSLRDSSAILIWLARQYGDELWMPSDPEREAAVNAWLFATAFELRLGPYEARLGKLFPSLCVAGDSVVKNTSRALQLFEARLSERTWLALEHPTIADIAAFPALAHCGDGGVELSSYPGLLRWLDRVRSMDGFVELLA